MAPFGACPPICRQAGGYLLRRVVHDRGDGSQGEGDPEQGPAKGDRADCATFDGQLGDSHIAGLYRKPVRAERPSEAMDT